MDFARDSTFVLAMLVNQTDIQAISELQPDPMQIGTLVEKLMEFRREGIVLLQRFDQGDKLFLVGIVDAISYIIINKIRISSSILRSFALTLIGPGSR